MALLPTDVVYQEPYRNLFGCVAHNTNAELGKWIILDADLELDRLGGAFLGVDTATKKVVLVDGDNTGSKLIGWANRSVDKRLYKVGEQMHTFFDNQITFQLPVDGDPATVRETIDKMRLGDTFALKVVTEADGRKVQKVDPTAGSPNACVSILDTAQPGRDYVRVRMIPGKVNMA